MKLLNDLLAGLDRMAGSRLRRPEYRQIELYTKKKNLSFAAEPSVPSPAEAPAAGALWAALLLDAALDARHPEAEGKTGWQKYLALPRKSGIDKVVAELFRMLRIVRAVAVHPHGHVEFDDGIVKLNGAIHQVALTLEITPAGLGLLESAVAWFLESREQPYPEAYVEAMLYQYLSDIVGEVKRFADEDSILYQYRPPFFFNRHFRFDCDNPKMTVGDGRMCFEVGPIHRDPVRTPIDFFVLHDNALHIVPVEALTDFALPLDELPRWRARTPDGFTLPAAFRQRFGREVMVQGLPMT
ncbi:MAG: hypothetical protein NVV74_03415 [Magnetospirillum sp.]|nr:hypothetical protein [Magnetospirillum sp.]